MSRSKLTITLELANLLDEGPMIKPEELDRYLARLQSLNSELKRIIRQEKRGLKK